MVSITGDSELVSVTDHHAISINTTAVEKALGKLRILFHSAVIQESICLCLFNKIASDV